MALSTAVFVGEAKAWIPEVVDRARKLKVSAGNVPDADLGPVISPQAKDRISSLVDSGIQEGAKCILDGRNVTVPGYEKGNFVAPTILADVKVSGLWKGIWEAVEPSLVGSSGAWSNCTSRGDVSYS